MAYNEDNNLVAMLEGGAREKGMSIAQIAQAADIPERYCIALFAGEYHKLPPPPYARGYLLKIAALLDVDGEILWRAYMRENAGMKTSGAQDKFPPNRFAVKKISRRGVVFIILAALVILYGAYFVFMALRSPWLTVSHPGPGIIVVDQQYIELAGKAGLGYKLVINEEETPVSRSGEFSKTISLSPGMNTIIFKASRFLGGERTVIRQIDYRP